MSKAKEAAGKVTGVTACGSAATTSSEAAGHALLDL